jgi:hypothetical protein
MGESSTAVADQDVEAVLAGFRALPPDRQQAVLSALGCRRLSNAVRDAQIRTLRAENPRQWTYARLAERFGLNTPDAVRKVVHRGGHNLSACESE